MPISKQQLKILAFPYTDYDALICDGAIRSGKTSLMMVAFVRWAMENFNGFRFGICGKTVESAINNAIQPFMSMTLTKETYQIKWNRTSKTAVIRYGKNENTFEVFGGKDERSQDLIQGRTLAGILLDEVALMPRSFVEQATARCSVEGAKLWFSCNPSSPSHWFYKEWMCKLKEKNVLHLHFKLTDNPSLSDKKIKEYENRFEGVFYERFILGRWVAAEGVIYRQFADHTEQFTINPAACRKKIFQVVAIGLDYGAGKSRTTMKAVGFTQGFKQCYILAEKDLDEVYDPDTLYRKFHDFYRAVVNQFRKCQYVFGDWGGLGNVLNEGLYVYCRKNKIPVKVENCTKGTILERIELTQQLMAQGRLYVSDDCTNMIKALKEAVWSDKRPDERLDDGTSDIDSLDAFEYALIPFDEHLQRAVDYAT